MNDIALKIGNQTSSLGIRWLRVLQQINEIPAARLELILPTDNNDTSDTALATEVGRLSPGVSIEISLDKVALFTGFLTQKKVQLRGAQRVIKIEARHALQKLAWPPRSDLYRQQTDRAILTSLFNKASVKTTVNVDAKLTAVHEQMVQYRVSDWNFICRRMKASNCWLVPDAASNAVTVKALKVPASAALTFKQYDEKEKYALYELDLSFDNRFVLDTLAIQGWDVSEQSLNTPQLAKNDAFVPWKPAASAATSPQSGGTHDYKLAFSYFPENDLSTLSRSWVNYHQMSGAQGSLVMEGSRSIAPGDSIALDDFGAGLDGTALVSGVEQIIDTENGWRTRLLIGMPVSQMEADITGTLHIGTVADYNPDPQNIERIPVVIPALNVAGEYLFARLGKPYASKASGFCFYPEPGDEVVLGFIEGAYCYPVILGSMHNPKNKSPFAPDKKNNQKALVVNKNNITQQFLIDLDAKTLTLSADNGSKVVVDANTQLQVNAQDMTWQAANKFTINGKSQVEIISASINMKN
ncbi:phage baseplate assembly protein V [Kosakonia sp. BYX6]|uniref:Phage baseplate assembly protein V n=1 Tax=Kosakonia calanthes TaxID=3139408 RepID=A0ABZ3BA80_9ENTR